MILELKFNKKVYNVYSKQLNSTEIYFKKNIGNLNIYRVMIVKGVFKSLFDEITYSF